MGDRLGIPVTGHLDSDGDYLRQLGVEPRFSDGHYSMITTVAAPGRLAPTAVIKTNWPL